MKKGIAVLTILFFLGALIETHLLWAQESTKEAAPAAANDEKQPANPSPAENQSQGAAGTFTPYAVGEVTVPNHEEAAPPKSKGLDERVSLDLRNIEVTEALRFLAMKGGLNLAVSKSVSGRLMLLLNDVPIKDVLDIILLTNDLALDKQGVIYNIMTGAEYKERYGRKFSDARKVKIYHLQYAIPDQVFGMMDALKSEVGRVLVDQESGTALVLDTPKNLENIESALNALEQKRTVRVFALKYAKAKEVEERLQVQLDAKKVGSITADETTNQVIVQTLPERMNSIAQLIESLDRKTKQVMLIAKILKVAISDDYNREIKWEGFFKQFGLLGDGSGTSNDESFIGNHELSPLARTGSSFLDDFANIASTTRPTQGSKNVWAENLFFGATGERKYELMLKFLRTLGDTKVLSSPRLTILNNQEAKIHVGEREAYVTTTTTTGTSTSTTAEQVTFVDVGIQLSVTPTINDDGFISMKIKPTISSVARSLTTPSKNTIPIIDTSEAETSVMVKDGTTIIIAGLRRDDHTDKEPGVPFIGSIPLVGRLFKNVVITKKRTELLILLTPHITDGTHMVTGEPPAPTQAMKPYDDYSDVAVQHKKPGPNPFFSFIKKVFLFGHD